VANEVYVSAQGNTLATNVLRRELEFLLYQKPFMRRLISFRGSTQGSGAIVVKIGQIDYDDVAESVNEGSAVSGNTALTTGTYSLTPGRIAIKRVLSDLLAGIDSTGMMNEQALAAYNFAAIMKKMDALVGTALASLTGTAGTSGVRPPSTTSTPRSRRSAAGACAGRRRCSSSRSSSTTSSPTCAARPAR